VSTRQSYPVNPPTPPYFRGVDELDGGVGDLLYGTYGRGKNTMVVDATSLAKRSGYMKAFNERFHGPAAHSHHREPGYNYTIVTDADGLKILAATSQVKGGGNRYQHVSYPYDDFDRASSLSLGNASSGGTKFWLEGLKGHANDVAYDTDIAVSAAETAQLSIAGAEGTADIAMHTPYPYWVWRLELKLASLNPDNGVTNTDHSMFLSLFMGLPLDHYDSDLALQQYKWTVGGALAKDPKAKYNPNTGSSGHSQDHPWMGVRWDLEIKSDRTMVITQRQYLSEYATNESPDSPRNGKLVLAGSLTHTFASDGDLQKTHYLEVGRIQTQRGEVQQRFNFYAGQTSVSAEYAEPTLAFDGTKFTIDKEPTAHPGWHNVVSHPQGWYGHCGFFWRLGCASTINLDSFSVAGGFLK
jgi:hypothetical protein